MSKAGKERRGQEPSARSHRGGRRRGRGRQGRPGTEGSWGGSRRRCENGASALHRAGGLHEGFGTEGQSWPAGPGDRPPRGPVPSGVLLKTGNKRAGTGHQGKLSTWEQEAGCLLSPRLTESVFWMPGINLHPADTKTPGSCPLTPENLCHRVSTVMKRELGTGRSSGTALDSLEPDLQAAAPCPELGPWTALPAGLEIDCACPSAGGGALG